MAMWHCPHCGTPQAEASRCWVCHRSSTTCSTCRNFRRAVAGQVGFCGLDRRRAPLRGDEIRGCWEVGHEHLEEPPDSRVDETRIRRIHRSRDFVPIEELRSRDAAAPGVDAPRRSRSPAVEPSEAAPLVALDAETWRDRVSLFGDEA